ncbi:hypothetical protein AB6A40_002980 [Gnathostoma spinigerum]|uniref:Uncharacterized protein n=1 Tax=Gnathostoma spinigerum TaxID=75299 RepID=A0ABD6EFT5_9BILA
MRANSGSVLNVITVLLLLSEAKNLLDAAKGSSGRFRSKVRKGEAEGTSEIVGPRKSSTNVGNKERYEAKDSLEQNLDVDFDEYNLWKEIGYDGRGQWTDAETFREDENDYNNISEEDEVLRPHHKDDLLEQLCIQAHSI